MIIVNSINPSGMALRSKIETLVWFLKQPALYPQLGYLFYQRFLSHPKEKTREEATQWCKDQSITSAHAIEKITGEKQIKPVSDLFPEFFRRANAVIDTMPVKMGGEADLQLLYYLCQHCKAKIVVETGVAYGWSSSILLLSLINRENSTLFSSDMPYAKMNNEDFVGCLVPEEVKKNWKLLRLPDRQAFKKIDNEIKWIDLCHYDSDKSYRGRMFAYAWLWSRLRVGGIFISDDINDNLAFREFAESKNITPVVVYHDTEDKYVGLMIKPNC